MKWFAFLAAWAVAGLVFALLCAPLMRNEADK